MNSNPFSRRQFIARTGVAAGALWLSSDSLVAQTQTPAKRTAADQVTLGKTGLKLSRLGIGVGSNNGQYQRALGKEGFAKLLHYAYDHGITYFDCAEAYVTFDMVGDAIKGLPREKIFIQSKINKQPENILAAIDKHRTTYQTDYIDSMLVHCMMQGNWTESFKRLMDGLNEAKEKKWIKAKGVSCHSLPALNAAVKSEFPEVHLVRVNPQGAYMDDQADGWKARGTDIVPVMEAIKSMHEKGRGVIGMKLIGNGTFTDPADREKAIRFAMAHPEIDAVVIGVKSTAEIDEAIERVNAALAA